MSMDDITHCVCSASGVHQQGAHVSVVVGVADQDGVGEDVLSAVSELVAVCEGDGVRDAVVLKDLDADGDGVKLQAWRW